MANKGQKGFEIEELLRAYFLRAGMYVVRGVPLCFDAEDMTDVDVWLYERPTGSSRRRQIVDVKSKHKPKVFERLLWTRGLSELLCVDGAYVATTDKRSISKEMASRLGISLLDGRDLDRIAGSDKVLYPERIFQEELERKIKLVDRGRRSKDLFEGYKDLCFSLIDRFGANTVNRALDHFTFFSRVLGGSHPNGNAADVLVRLAYIAASIVALTLDFTLAQVSFRSAEERRNTLLNVVRFGVADEDAGMEQVRIAAALVDRYIPNGGAISQSMLNAVQADLKNIPAEFIADHVLTNLKGGALFRIARALEFEAFRKDLRGFDCLSAEEKSFLGVLLDFGAIERSGFADAWTNPGVDSAGPLENRLSAATGVDSPGSLFEN